MNATVANIADHEEDHSSVVAEVAVAPKTQPKKRQLKQMRPIKVSRSPSPIAQVAEEEVVIAPIVAEVAEQVAPISLAEICHLLADHDERIKRVEALGGKPKGYYAVADGDEELARTRQQNKDLRKEIEAKTKTNQSLLAQLDDPECELTRQKEINKGLRKENEGLTNTNKKLKAEMANPDSEVERLRTINATLRKEAEAERRLKLQYKTEKSAMLAQMEKYLAILESNGIVVEED